MINDFILENIEVKNKLLFPFKMQHTEQNLNFPYQINQIIYESISITNCKVLDKISQFSLFGGKIFIDLDDKSISNYFLDQAKKNNFIVKKFINSTYSFNEYDVLITQKIKVEQTFKLNIFKVCQSNKKEKGSINTLYTLGSAVSDKYKKDLNAICIRALLDCLVLNIVLKNKKADL